MNKVRGLVLGTVLGLFLMGLAFSVEAAGPSAEFSLDAMSKYVWRGGVYSDSAVLQPAMTISYQGFSWGFWGNLDLGNNTVGDDDAVGWTETDFTVSYTYDKLPYGLSLEVGTIYYACEPASDTTEIYAGLSGSIPSVGVDLGATLYRDIEDSPGFTLELTAGKSFSLPVEKTSLDLGATLYYMLPDEGNSYLNNLDMSASLGYKLSSSLSVSATLDCSLRLSDTAKENGIHSLLYGGVGLSYSF